LATYVYRNGEIVDKRDAGPKHQGDNATYVISDTMDETRHMADGKYYTSKTAFRQATKAAGCVEVGNETSTLLKPRKPVELDRRQRREDIQRTIYELKNRR
jgi:hypothetical protein